MTASVSPTTPAPLGPLNSSATLSTVLSAPAPFISASSASLPPVPPLPPVFAFTERLQPSSLSLSTFSLSHLSSYSPPHTTSLFTLQNQDIVLSSTCQYDSAFASKNQFLIQDGHIILPMPSPSIPIALLIDSGADNNFISSTFVTHHGLPIAMLSSPINLQLADGSVSTISHSTVALTLQIGQHLETITFLITDLSRSAILGYPWLSKHNPTIDWSSKSLLFNPSSSIAISHIESAKFSELVYPNFSETTSAAGLLPQKIIDRYSDVFSKTNASLLAPHRPGFDFAINLEPSHFPPSSKVYNLTGDERIAMKKWLDENLANGFIKSSHSPYAAPCFFIKKKSGELRLCMDYRKLNNITVKTRYPLPLISEIIRAVSAGNIFTALDLRGAYNLLRVREGDEHKLSFITNYGQYEFCVMPFGPCDAPGYFQAFMNALYGHLPFVCIYLDDIIIFSHNLEEHWDHVKQVLEILKQNKLYCKLEKCIFAQTSLNYLGYVISSTSVAMDPKKLSAIADWPAPTTRKELESFLGFLNFYRRFIAHYSDKTAVLSDLLQKGLKFHWTKTLETTFQNLKLSFTSALTLIHPDDSLPFEVECDCSDFALGSVLSQRLPDNTTVPIAFFSRKLNPAERNYPIYDKELLSIHESFQEWRHFLQGARVPVVVWSDHKSLTYFMTTKQLTRRHGRWSLFFSGFSFIIKDRPGSANFLADTLSRRPDFSIGLSTDNNFSLLHPDQFVPEIASSSILNAVSTLPIQTLHSRFGHPGSAALSRTLASYPDVRPIGTLSKSPCSSCELGKSKRRPFGVSSKRAYEPLEVISADIQYFSTISNDGTSTNIKFIDHGTKYLKTFLLANRTAACVLEDLAPFVARMERQAGKQIKFIRTDQGTEFDGVVLEFLSAKGIVRQKTTPYYHIDPGLAEHAHQTVLYTARSILIASRLPLVFYGDALLTATYLHNRLVHSGASKTPYELLKGRPPRIDHLRSFGCLAYVYIPAETRSKLAPSAVRCRLIGYGDDDDIEEIRGYKFVDESDISFIIYSSDARFDETEPLPLPGHTPFDFNTQGDNIFGDPSYSDSDEEETTRDQPGRSDSHVMAHSSRSP